MTVGIICYGVVTRHGFGRALALGGATPIGAAAVLGNIALPTFFAVALFAAAGCGLRYLSRTRDPGQHWPRVPAGRTLQVFVLTAAVVTMAAPLLFNGVLVQAPGGGTQLVAGVVTKSNVAQLTYLALCACVVIFLARSRSSPATLIGLAACTTTVLSFWAWLGSLGVPFPVGLFDNSPAFTFQQTLPGGAPRVRGILSEPAGLATTSLVTLAYGASRLQQLPPQRRVALVAVMAMATYLGWISTSATFFVAGAALLLVAGIVHATLFASGRSRLGAQVVAAFCAVAVAAVWLLPLATDALSAVIETKKSSSSYDDRSGSDALAYHLVWDTAGMGVGLGANRASSFVATLLSTVGIVGTLLFVALVWIIFRDSWAVQEARPAAWALIAFLVTKAVSGPDLADTSGILWMSLGVLAHAALNRGSPRPVLGEGTVPAAVPPRLATVVPAREAADARTSRRAGPSQRPRRTREGTA